MTTPAQASTERSDLTVPTNTNSSGPFSALHTPAVQVDRMGNIALVKELMDARMFGPDARIFQGKDIGPIPALPANIMEILSSPCELAKDGRTVGATHILGLLPASIDGTPLTLNSLREFAAATLTGRNAPSLNVAWDDKDSFANQPLAQSMWVLAYETVAPNTTYKSGFDQEAVVSQLRNHRTAKLLELVGALVLHDLEHGKRFYSKVYGRCKEPGMIAGAFDDAGLLVRVDSDTLCLSHLGRAVVWKLNP